MPRAAGTGLETLGKAVKGKKHGWMGLRGFSETRTKATKKSWAAAGTAVFPFGKTET